MTIFEVQTDASSRYRAILQQVAGEDRWRKVYPSAIGVAIYENGRLVGTISETIGYSDSNTAEYWSLYAACLYLHDQGIKKVNFHVDSLNLAMMVNQRIISGTQEVRDLSYEILRLLGQLESYTMTWGYRRYNHIADTLARKAFSSHRLAAESVQLQNA